jgi:hypothetical protein
MSIISSDKLIVLYWNNSLCRMQWGGLCESDKEEVQPSSCCYCIIPWPCPPGKDPRSPLVPHLSNGKPYWFTFSQLSHLLRLVCYCCPVPLSSLKSNSACYWPRYSDRWSSVSLGRSYGILWSLSSSGASQLTEYLSFEPSYGGCLRQIDNLIRQGFSSWSIGERCSHNSLGHLAPFGLGK